VGEGLQSANCSPSSWSAFGFAAARLQVLAGEVRVLFKRADSPFEAHSRLALEASSRHCRRRHELRDFYGEMFVVVSH